MDDVDVSGTDYRGEERARWTESKRRKVMTGKIKKDFAKCSRQSGIMKQMLSVVGSQES